MYDVLCTMYRVVPGQPQRSGVRSVHKNLRLLTKGLSNHSSKELNQKGTSLLRMWVSVGGCLLHDPACALVRPLIVELAYSGNHHE